MPDYRVPVEDMRSALAGLGGLERLHAAGLHRDLTQEIIDAVLEEAARFAELELGPLYRSADRCGATLEDGRVRTAQGMREAYAKFAAAGWVGVAAPPAFGGQGLPNVVAVPVAEMWRQANLAFALCPMLTQSAIEALLRHGNEALQSVFLPKLVAGEWTGTMNLTESQAGSDLAAIKTVATPDGERYRLRGRKIFITWGDHDFTDNIVHFVLARTSGAPEGIRGLSLFLVPKRLPMADGALGALNDVTTVSLEHKLGIRASPTCVLSYGDGDGAVGYLVGRLHDGLSCMFTMMNRARLAVGVEALGVAERAYRQASAYAHERVQGVAPGGSQRVPIIEHPDVRRMLLVMKAELTAMRALAYSTALEIDLAQDGAGDPSAVARASLLTPVVKAWCSETAQEIVSLALQVHGGAGYIEETGAAQPMRDVRITTIYEGTTAIQANDFVRRQLAGDGGRAAFDLLAEIRAELDAGRDSALAARFRSAIEELERCARFVLERQHQDPALSGAIGVNLLLAFGNVLGGVHCWRQAARSSPERAADGPKWGLARFYAEQLLPRASALCASVLAGSEGIMSMRSDWL